MQADCGSILNLKEEASKSRLRDQQRNIKSQKGVTQEARTGGLQRIEKLKNGKTEDQFFDDRKHWKEKEDEFWNQKAIEKAEQEERFIDNYIEQVRIDKINEFRQKLQNQTVKEDPFRRKVCVSGFSFKLVAFVFVVGLLLKSTDFFNLPRYIEENLTGGLIVTGILGGVLYLINFSGKKKVEENDELQVQNFINEQV